VIKIPFFKKKTMADNAIEFQEQYSIAKIIIFKYLKLWFKQTFELPDWKQEFLDKPNMPITMTAEVLRYLFGDDDSRNISKLEQKDEIEMAKCHAEKWADDCMTRDASFREFVIQTIRLDMIYHQSIEGIEWYRENSKGIKVWNIIQKYGEKVEKSPNPEDYTKLLNNWIRWDEITSKKLNS